MKLQLDSSIFFKLFFSLCLFVTVNIFSFEPVIILFGPPGSGKGTFSQHLKKNHGFHHVSAGDVVRREIKNNTLLGKKIEAGIMVGDCVESKEMDEIIEQEVSNFVEVGGPLILDGFVHSESDFDSLQKLIERLNLKSRTFIMYLNADDKVCEERILGRLICPRCEHVEYSAGSISNNSKKCEKCQSDLEIRINDSPEVAKKRIMKYRDYVEKCCKKGENLFPFIHFEANGSAHDCKRYYSHLVAEAERFYGSPDEFVKLVQPASDP